MSVVRLNKLNYRYPDGTVGLLDINLTINQNECLALVGGNGAGKSTLLLALATLIRCEGTVEMFGTELSNRTVKALRSRIGMLFQDPDDQLIFPTVIDDVAFGPQNSRMERNRAYQAAHDALSSLGIDHLADRSPLKLSVGQRKRAALAGVLATRPELLLLDEPTAGLDGLGREALIEALSSRPETKVIATHDLELIVQLADRIALMDGGQIIAVERARKILNNVELLRRYHLCPSPQMQRLNTINGWSANITV